MSGLDALLTTAARGGFSTEAPPMVAHSVAPIDRPKNMDTVQTTLVRVDIAPPAHIATIVDRVPMYITFGRALRS